MRRILRKVAAGEVTMKDIDNDEDIRERLGDISTLADQTVVNELIKTTAQQVC